MRLPVAVVVCCCTAAAPWANGETTFPYKARIVADDVYVRSGPGQSYYPTDKLKVGQEIEVYRHDPGGWCAIKPPEGSFTWVSGRYLKPGVDSLALVTSDRLAARVGSRFSDIRDVIQVRLHEAEVVEVLQSKQSADGSTTWYKIAPPSGEFRWVFGKYVDTDYPHDGVRKTHAADRLLRADDTPADLDWQSTQEPSTQDQSIQPQPATDRQQPIFTPKTPRGLSPEEYQTALEEIDLQLSAMVVEEPTVWTFHEVRRRAESLLDQAETALERGRARTLVNKMDRFEDIKLRYDDIHVARTRYERSTRPFAALARGDRDLDAGLEPAGRFDGVGQLTRVVSPKLGAPRYALVDRTGGVHCYVTPAPGVPLRHYIGRRVGVNGTRGFMPEQHAHHIMARHVSPLNSRIR